MRTRTSPIQQRSPAAPTSNGATSANPLRVKEIPYDYVAHFTLNGLKPGNRVQDVINISTDGAFVAVSIGYGFIPSPNTPPPPPGPILPDRTIDFLYSIVDSGTGRELQNRSIYNIAGLGEANGKRPFRPLAKPMVFMPRSTIRIEVEEMSIDKPPSPGGTPVPFYQEARLFIVFHGYKLLGYGT